MKSSTTFSLLALAASAASSPLAAPELEDRTFFFPGCSPENKVLIFAGLDQEFCSAYLQPTSTATVVKTALSTAFATTTATQTVILTSTVTPSPAAAPPVCGVKGYATATAITTFFNNDGSFTQASCQAQCLSLGSPTGTFAFGGTLCACYVGNPTVAAAAQADAPYTFSDVNCPPPTGDAGAAPPAGKRAAPVCGPASAKIPPPLIQKINPGPARISSACECLLNKQTPATCTVVKTVTVSATTTLVATQSATITNTVTVTAA